MGRAPGMEDAGVRKGAVEGRRDDRGVGDPFRKGWILAIREVCHEQLYGEAATGSSACTGEWLHQRQSQVSSLARVRADAEPAAETGAVCILHTVLALHGLQIQQGHGGRNRLHGNSWSVWRETSEAGRWGPARGPHQGGVGSVYQDEVEKWQITRTG